MLANETTATTLFHDQLLWIAYSLPSSFPELDTSSISTINPRFIVDTGSWEKNTETEKNSITLTLIHWNNEFSSMVRPLGKEQYHCFRLDNCLILHIFWDSILRKIFISREENRGN